MEGTSVVDVLVWLAGLLLRSRRDVPPAARPLWWAVWTLLVAKLALLLLGGFAWLHDRLGALQALGSMSAVVVAASLALQWVLVAYIGDAARYLSPRPRNIRLRQSIRAQGVRLLRELQSRGPQPYDRVVLVGHSLGSVIAYDLINHLWLSSDTRN